MRNIYKIFNILPYPVIIAIKYQKLLFLICKNLCYPRYASRLHNILCIFFCFISDEISLDHRISAFFTFYLKVFQIILFIIFLIFFLFRYIIMFLLLYIIPSSIYTSDIINRTCLLVLNACKHILIITNLNRAFHDSVKSPRDIGVVFIPISSWIIYSFHRYMSVIDLLLISLCEIIRWKDS